MRLGLRSRNRKTLRPRAWGCSPESPKPVFLTETTGPPRFLEDPAMNVPCSSTPAGPLRSATAAHWCCLPLFGRRRLPRLSAFRGSITRPAHSLSTLRRVGCPTATQDSLSGGWPALPGGTAYPPGPNERFQFIPSSFPRLRLAHPNSDENSTPFNSESDDDTGRPPLFLSLITSFVVGVSFALPPKRVGKRAATGEGTHLKRIARDGPPA